MGEGKIKVKIDPMGNAVFEGQGFSGTSCDQAMAPLESALGGKVGERINKPEYSDITLDSEDHVHLTG